MKKLLSVLALIGISSTALAGFNAGNSSAAAGSVQSVQAAQKMADDAQVTLEGKFVRQLDNDEFMFRDNSGEIKIDVEDEAWNGQEITPNDKVRIQGKVDKDWNKVSIDVYKIQKIQ